jgi:hypothetical protein
LMARWKNQCLDNIKRNSKELMTILDVFFRVWRIFLLSWNWVTLASILVVILTLMLFFMSSLYKFLGIGIPMGLRWRWVNIWLHKNVICWADCIKLFMHILQQMEIILTFSYEVGLHSEMERMWTRLSTFLIPPKSKWREPTNSHKLFKSTLWKHHLHQAANVRT